MFVRLQYLKLYEWSCKYLGLYVTVWEQWLYEHSAYLSAVIVRVKWVHQHSACISLVSLQRQQINEASKYARSVIMQ